MLGQRSDRRMSTAHKRLAIFATIAFVLVYLGWDVLGGLSSPAPAEPNHYQTKPDEETVATTAATPIDADPNLATPGASLPTDRVGYAIALPDIAGLSPDAAPGSYLQLWVTWDPPITKRPRLQKLIDRVVLEEIVPPVTAQGPRVAMLSVARGHLDELLWADRYGSLSAAIVMQP